ncbi:MAG: protein translocase subunit SecD [Phycisphaerales bacterium]|nr:protein translocase subunit SecD [Phycisphaerales bacterium]
MRHYVRNMTIAIAMLILAFVASNPPAEKIGLGKDLRGGASLIYSVEISSTETAGEVIPQVIDVLKKRIDPNGLFEISIVRQGQDRIEITMPLPSDHVKELKAAFVEELSKLSITSIDPDDFERMMRLPADEREAELKRVGAASDSVYQILLKSAAAYDLSKQLRSQLDIMSLNTDIDETTLDALVGQVAQAELDYELARDETLATAISPESIKRALEQSKVEKTLKDGDDYIVIPSPRERSLDRIREQYPEIGDQLETVIAAYDLYSENRNSLDDTADLKRLVQAAGVLSFRITADPSGRGNTGFTHPEETRLRELFKEKGPKQAGTRDARWFKINKPDSWYSSVSAYESMIANPAQYFYSYGGTGYVVEEYNNDYYMLAWDSRGLRMTQEEGRWKVARAYQSADQLGRPAIGFQMNQSGALRMGALTGDNVGAHMAVLLDDEVFTAPTLNARITNQGIIEGEFTMDEINYVIRVLGAGSLQAKLSPEPLSENIIAPELGQDNLVQGVNAGKLALIIVSVFMVVYYFGYGLVAVLCLTANALLILGALALSRASLTLPGIAGIILTFGMAVDANVLIYERIREELNGGLDLRQAVKIGYAKALSSIVDGNVTNLIVCLVLANVGTQEIRGFAITLGIGVVCTMISALFINHLIMSTLVDRLKIRKMAMLPMAVKPIERMLKPKINWISLRWITGFISLGLVSLGISMVVFEGANMLDTEFRGGTQVTLTFKDSDTDDGTKMTMERAGVIERVQALGEDTTLAPLRNAEVTPVNPQSDGVTSDTFIIKTTATNRNDIGTAITRTFQDYLDVPPPLEFEYSLAQKSADAPVYPVLEDRLGDVIARPDFRNDVSAFSGGVAVYLQNMSPTQSLEQLKNRLAITRQKDDFTDVVGRKTALIITEGNEDAVISFALLALDPGLDFFANPDAWRSEVAQREWDLIRASLADSSDQLSVQSFSPAIAENFRATAFAAVLLSLLLILIYIWVRFGSVRYSLAAIVALTHDVLVVIGLIALSEIIYDIPSMNGITQALMIEPFKIDLNLVAALLTIIGYSLNDTIVIMDRIRENRGKLSYASKEVINRSINETVSRTLITSGTTILAVFLLYVYGGQGVHAFSFALLVGVMIGTYSSVAIASPMVWARKKDISMRREAEAELLAAEDSATS